MTKELLNEIENDYWNEKADPIDMTEVFDLANRALEQPCEDCISREAVKEMLREEWTKYIPMELDINLSFVLEKISELPSVTPTISDIENNFDIGYNCGYADAMFDIAEGE